MGKENLTNLETLFKRMKSEIDGNLNTLGRPIAQSRIGEKNQYHSPTPSLKENKSLPPFCSLHSTFAHHLWRDVQVGALCSIGVQHRTVYSSSSGLWFIRQAEWSCFAWHRDSGRFQLPIFNLPRKYLWNRCNNRFRLGERIWVTGFHN